MTKACYRLFQVNKIPLDTDLEQAFKFQIQVHYPNKIRELADNSSEWIKLWNAIHSIVINAILFLEFCKELFEDDQDDQNNDSEVDQESGTKEIIN
ncbi:hypothetical protein RhiirA5_437704 [Rhizophagus irregularis]|uniref:Uncharacterized protein n=1 Tax=Rhizophagus irregularis TaxID=588596 RepID=A0A2N0NK43_9GLOM|nr:hypothetical protein RhiirA5_437704 [Rhizophagus irregularis]